jgi:membrane protein required for beta-lactamase induction
MRRLSKLLIRAGLAVWTFGLVAAVSGVWVTLPPVAVEFLVLGLALSSGAVLVGAGVAVSNAVRREDRAKAASSALAHDTGHAPKLVNGGWPAPIAGAKVRDRMTARGDDAS